MGRSLTNRLILVTAALLTLAAYGERVFARFLACDCPCGPAQTALAVVADDGKGATTHAAGESVGTAAFTTGEADAKTAGGSHHSDGKDCPCSCHASTVAAIHAGTPALAAQRTGEATLHADPTQRPVEGVRAGIEYPPRAA